MATELEIAFPTLSDRDVDSLRPAGHERAVSAGEVLFAEGERDFCFFLVLEGSIQIVEHSSDVERIVATHTAGQFTGDVDMLTGRAAIVSSRAAEAGRVLQIGAHDLRHAVQGLPDLGETLLKAFLMRRTLLLRTGFEGVRIIGSRFSQDAHRLRDFATRNAVPFTWIDLERDAHAEALLEQFNIPASATPVVMCREGKFLTNPSNATFAHAIGLEAHIEPGEIFDLVVVGAGPAGLAASVYAASEGLRTITFDGLAPGGQAGTSSRIENYLGFPTGVSGADLTGNALVQAQRFGARVTVPGRVTGLMLDGEHRIVALDDGSEIRSRCVLVASGVQYRRLDIPGFDRFESAGVYYAATEMEARLCRDDDVVVVGGGNSAGQAVVYLTRYAKKVHLVVRGSTLGASMSRYLVERVECMPKVEVHLNCQVSALDGNGHLSAAELTYGDGTTRAVNAGAIFLFIGAAAHTSWLSGCVALDRNGFVLTGPEIPGEHLDERIWSDVSRRPMHLETSLPGIFAAGDVRSGSMKRVASAVGEGAMAVSFVHSHLS
jgi:thioredoxin reductase (NADPH)